MPRNVRDVWVEDAGANAPAVAQCQVCQMLNSCGSLRWLKLENAWRKLLLLACNAIKASS